MGTRKSIQLRYALRAARAIFRFSDCRRWYLSSSFLRHSGHRNFFNRQDVTIGALHSKQGRAIRLSAISAWVGMPRVRW
jgi:hypothetical protein